MSDIYADASQAEQASAQKLRIFELIGSLRTTDGATCHLRSEEVRKKLRLNNYRSSGMLQVVWSGKDHVCALIVLDGEDICVDVTIGQFTELGKIIATPNLEGMVFIGSKAKWIETLGEMFGKPFESYTESVKSTYKELTANSLLDIDGIWADDGSDQDATSGQGANTAVQPNLHGQANLKRTGCCILF